MGVSTARLDQALTLIWSKLRNPCLRRVRRDCDVSNYMPESEDTLPRRVRRQADTLGHAFSRLAAGIAVLTTRVRKGNLLDEATRAWLQPWLGADETRLDLPIDTTGAALIAWHEEGAWRVLNPCHEEGQTALSDSWQRALVLLHLPVLRDYWTRALRRRRFARLRRVLPQAWPVDPQPLPPGAVMAGTNVADWTKLSETQRQVLEERALSTGQRVMIERKSLLADEQMLVLRWATNEQYRIAAVHFGRGK